ncbi:MAG TPA: hypothetical protein VG892_12490, partial [Terriglobales bacterium]|nr:hypothetical protein [Terriglobales bacterium]
SVRPSIEQLHVSHRPSRKLNGALHEETNYSRPRKYGKKDVVHIRKLVHELSEKQILDETVIVDRRVREAVQTKLQEVDGNPKKLETEYPVLKTRKGASVPIRKVRIRVPGTVETVGEGSRERYISTGNNHHIAIFSTKDKKGRPIWESPGVVSRLDAMRRRRRGEPIVENKLPGSEDAEFVFSLMGGDMVEMDDLTSKTRNLFVIRTMSEFAGGRIQLSFVRHTDARLKAEIIKAEDWLRIGVDGLRERNCRKVVVDVLGRLREARD